MGKIDVCHECAERYPACHDHCERYKEAKRRIQEEKDLINKNKMKDAVYVDYKRKKFQKRNGEK